MTETIQGELARKWRETLARFGTDVRYESALGPGQALRVVFIDPTSRSDEPIAAALRVAVANADDFERGPELEDVLWLLQNPNVGYRVFSIDFLQATGSVKLGLQMLSH